MPAVSLRTQSKLARNLGLLASASIMSLTMAGEARANCIASSGDPLANIITPNSAVNCIGADNGQTITVNTDGVEAGVSGAGSSLTNSNVTLNGNNNSFSINTGTSVGAVYYASTGSNNLLGISGQANGLAAAIGGSNDQLTIFSSGAVTALPGDITLTAAAGQNQFATVAGSLTASGPNGSSYLLTGGTGNQFFDISGTLTGASNGLLIDAGDGNDHIYIGASANVSNGFGGAIFFEGGAGNDQLTLYGTGTWNGATSGIERLNVDTLLPNGLRILDAPGSYSEVNLAQGSLGITNSAALGLSNSTVTFNNSAQNLIIAVGGPATFNNSFVGAGTIIQNGQTLTYGGNGSGFTGLFRVATGTAVITSSNAFGTAAIQNDSALQLTNITLGNTISGSGTVTKIGAGTGTLSGVNTYSDGTLVSGGTLRLTNGSAAGSGSVAVLSGSNLELDFATDQTFANDITGSGSLIKNGIGIATLTGANTYSGGTTINAGSIRVDDLARLGTGPVVANANGSLILDYNGAGQLLITNPFLSGAGYFIKEGTGDVVLDAANTYAGGTWIRNGSLGLNDGGALGSGVVLIDSGAELRLGNIVFSNDILGNGSVVKTASGITEIYGGNSAFNGTMHVTDGTLFATIGDAFGSGTLRIDNGTSALLNAGTTTVMAADLAGAGVFEKSGSGHATLTGDGTAFSGTISITNGTLQIAGTQNIGGATVLVDSAGTLQLDTAGFSVFNNALMGAGNLIKTGTGTVSLTTAANHTGGTDIQQGAIRVTDVSFLGTGPVTVQAGAALDLSIANAQTLNQTIAGAGMLRKSDQGDLTLTGNSLTGGLDIVGGRVIVNTAGAIGGGPVSMAADTQLVFDNSATEIMSNPLSGAGSLTKNGTGLLVIQNANTYTGGTTINAGRLGLNNGQGLGTGTVLVMLNAELGLGGVTVANNIIGAGRVVKTANNTGALTGNNSYSGGTDIQEGTLIVNSPAALGTGGVAIASNAFLAIDYNGASNAVMTNVLSGAGALVKDGSGTVVINTAGNTYSGGTAINAGRLGLNFGDGLGTGNVVIGAGASLGLGNVTYGNNTSGAGQIVKTATGTTTLTGTNTHTGGIDVQAGTLAVTGNSSLGTGTVNIASGATFNYTNTSALTFSNGLSGAGTFNKLGTGLLTFGSNFTVGALNLTAGRTRMNVIGTTNVTVGANATLDGTGRIIGNLTNNGTVAPGNSIGTLTVQGNYVQNAGSILEIEFDGSGGIDVLAVTGTATLNGGTLRFISLGGAEGNGGTFLTATGGVTGTFTTVETVGALLPLAVIYNSNNAQMAPSVLTARPSTFNAQSMAAADTALGFIDSLGVADLRHGKGNRIWLNGFGAWGKRSASGSTLGYDHETRGMSGGVNLAAGDAFTVGAAIGWAKGDITLTDNGGGGDQSSVLGSIHARYSGTGVTLGGGMIYGKVDQDTLRNVSFNGFSGSVNGSTKSNIFGGFAELGVPLGSTGKWAFSANMRGSYIRQKQDGYTESGTSPLRLTLGELKTSTIEGQAGLTAKTSLWAPETYAEDHNQGIDLRIDLGTRYMGTVGDRLIPVTFAVSNAGIVLQGDTRNTLQGQFGLALDYTTRNNAVFSIGYQGEVGATDRHAVTAGVSFAF